MCCGPRPLLDGSVFVAREIVTRVGFTAATARLANLLTGNTLQNASRSAYGDGLTALIPVGPAPGLTRLVRAQFRDLVVRDDTAVLTVRWEATGTGADLVSRPRRRHHAHPGRRQRHPAASGRQLPSAAGRRGRDSSTGPS